MRSLKRVLEPGGAGERASGGLGPQGQHGGGVLEGLALEQAGEEEVALLPQGQLVVEIAVVEVGQQAPGLQLDQRGRDEQELGGDLEVEGLHAPQLDHVGVDDGGEGHLVDVDLLAQDEVQKQIERALVDRGLDRVRHGPPP